MMATCRCRSATAVAVSPSGGRPNSVGQRPGGVKREQRQPCDASIDMPQASRSAGTAAAEHEQFGQPKTSTARDPTRARASSGWRAGATLPSTARRPCGSNAASRRRRAAAAPGPRRGTRWPRADRVGNRVAIGVAQVERVHQRHAQREGVALVGRELRRFEHALEVEPAQRQRRQADVESEQRAADVPRHAGRHLRTRGTAHAIRSRISASFAPNRSRAAATRRRPAGPRRRDRRRRRRRQSRAAPAASSDVGQLDRAARRRARRA